MKAVQQYYICFNTIFQLLLLVLSRERDIGREREAEVTLLFN